MQIVNISKVKHRAPLMLVAGSSSSVLQKGLWNRTTRLYELTPLNGVGGAKYVPEGKLVYLLKGTDLLHGAVPPEGEDDDDDDAIGALVS